MKLQRKSGLKVVCQGFCCILCIWVFASFSVKDKTQDDADKIVLKYADQVRYDQFRNPNMQIFIGNVNFAHKGLLLYCDSANFYQDTNSFQAFGRVKMVQGDSLTLLSEYLHYDGNSQIAEARKQVVLTHGKSVLYTDSLNYDRVYNIGYFFEGGKLIDDGNVLTSDWGQYNTANKQAEFRYNVQLTQPNEMVMTSDTLFYNTTNKMAHMLGPSNVIRGNSTIYTENGYYDTSSKQVTLLNRSVLIDNNQHMVADSVVHDQQRHETKAFRDIVFVDKDSKNVMRGDYCYHNDSLGYTIIYDKAEVRNFSQQDTLYLHADTFKIYTYNQKTDSVYRIIHGYHHSRSFKEDIQTSADSLSYNSLKKVLYLFGNPIVWNGNHQILGEEIRAHMNDSTLDSIHVINQALMVEKLDTAHYNQVAGKEMKFLFDNGHLKENRVMNNVQVVYYAYDDDSLMVGMNYMETSIARMFVENKRVSKIWTKESKGTFYPLAFASKDKSFLKNFAWFDYIRPKDRRDIFNWQSKKEGTELKQSVRHEVPFQNLKKNK